MNEIIKFLKGILKKLIPHKKYNSQIDYWEDRVEKFGARSVIHLGHTHEEYEKITKFQIDFLFPIYKNYLKGNEELILDFGCGPGRFTIDINKLTGVKIIGIDPIQKLLDIAPKTKDVEYLIMKEGLIPLPDNSVDSIWICLVFGSIIEIPIIENTISELNRVLKSNGTIFLVEKTSIDISNMQTKDVNFYINKFSFSNLCKIDEYYDLDDCNSVFIGIKK
jgi:ubiquinone/menaquinone biosynthesis C-methylase UbiE